MKKYNIKCTPQYYDDRNVPQERLLTYQDLLENQEDSNNYDILEYDTLEQAEEAIKKIQGTDIYYLSHGEASRPVYEIIDADGNDDDGDDCYEAALLLDNNYMMEMRMVQGSDLPKKIKEKIDQENVEYGDSRDDYDIYTAKVEIDNKMYGIAFCPKTIALQRYADDLGHLNWSNPAYFIET